MVHHLKTQAILRDRKVFPRQQLQQHHRNDCAPNRLVLNYGLFRQQNIETQPLAHAPQRLREVVYFPFLIKVPDFDGSFFAEGSTQSHLQVVEGWEW